MATCCFGQASTMEEEKGKRFTNDGGDRDVSKGPIKTRQCTDLLCIFLFLAHWCGFLFVTLLGVQDGNPRKLFMPRDYSGAYCGVEKQWNNGPDLKGFEKQFFMMNVTASVDMIAKELVCSSAAEGLLKDMLTEDELDIWKCACCKIQCASCTSSLHIQDLTSGEDVKATISARMQDLTRGDTLFSADGPNGDFFSSLWSQATTYFLKVCTTSCDAVALDRTRTYTYRPAPDDPLAHAWQQLLNGPVQNDIKDTLSKEFTFLALPLSVCPYTESKCVPMPGVEFSVLSGLENYCQFKMTSSVVSAVGSVASAAFEGLAATDFAASASESVGTWIGELEKTVWALVLVCVTAFIIGLMFLVLLRFFIGVMVWLSITLIFGLLVLGGAVAYVRSGQCAGASFLDSGKQNAFAAVGVAENAVNSAISNEDPLASETMTDKGQDYRGFQTRTVSGLTCQSWDTVSHDTFKPNDYPNAGLEANYCRNPTEGITIWCFTTDPSISWEVCHPLGVINPECTHGYAVRSESARTTLRFLGYVLWGMSMLWLLLVFCMRSRILLAIAVNKVAAMFVCDTPSIVLLPIVQSIIGLIWCVTWALSITFLISQVPESYTPTSAYATYAEAFGTADTPGACTDTWPTGSVWKDDDNCSSTRNGILPSCWRCAPPRFVLDARFAYSFFSFLWSNAFLVACGQCTIAGAVGIWFFTKNSEKRRVKKVWTAIWNVFRYHTGSLAFGSLILAIVQFIKYFMQYLEKQQQAQKNRVAACAFRMISWLLYCFEKCIKFINKNAYIQVALLGTNFCTSAKAGFQLVLRNFVRFSLIGALGRVTAFIGYVFITLATSISGYFILRAIHPEANPVVPMIVFVVVGYLVGRLYMAVFGMAVDTALQCFIICEEFRGEPADQKEQYVPDPLKKLVPQSDKESLHIK